MKLFYLFAFVAQTRRVELWLSNMADQGYKLTDVRGFFFFFEKCKSAPREYFIYKRPAFFRSDKFIGDYFSAKQMLGKKSSDLRNDSMLLFEIKEGCCVDEVRKYRLSRRAHYFRSCIQNLIACGILSALGITAALISGFNIFLMIVSAAFSVLFAGFAASAICLAVEKRKERVFCGGEPQ